MAISSYGNATKRRCNTASHSVLVGRSVWCARDHVFSSIFKAIARPRAMSGRGQTRGRISATRYSVFVAGTISYVRRRVLVDTDFFWRERFFARGPDTAAHSLQPNTRHTRSLGVWGYRSMTCDFFGVQFILIFLHSQNLSNLRRPKILELKKFRPLVVLAIMMEAIYDVQIFNTGYRQAKTASCVVVVVENTSMFNLLLKISRFFANCV